MIRLRTVMVGLICWGLMATSVWAESNHDAVRTTLQDRIDEYPLLPLNTDPHRARYVVRELNRNHFKLSDKYYDAIAFRTPAKIGEFVWSLVPVEQEVSWQIVAEEGAIEGFTEVTREHLRKGIPGVGYSGQPVIFQRLGVEQLRPNTTYLIWFSFRHTDVISVPISLNMFDEADRPFEAIHPNIFQPAVTKLTAHQLGAYQRILQEHAKDFATFEPAADTERSTYQMVSLNQDPLNVGYGYCDARVFQAPAAGGELTCSVAWPDNLAGWMIVPTEGDGPVVVSNVTVKRLFTQGLPRLFEGYDSITYQRASGLRFEGGRKFIFAMLFRDTTPTEVPVSMNILPQPNIPFRQIFPNTWATSAYKLTWDLMRVAGWKLHPNVNLTQKVDLYMQLTAPNTWLRAHNNEFEMREMRSRFIYKMRNEIDRFDESSEVVIYADYKFESYDFARECFPLVPVSGRISTKPGVMTITTYRKHQGVNLTKRQLTCRMTPAMQCLSIPQAQAKIFLASRTDPGGNVNREVYTEIGMRIMGLDGKEDRKLRGEVTSFRIYADPKRAILLRGG